jgi:uncharacterized membrane protein YeaQ/YmgE (transglycosylase-associated protein family)
LCWPPYPVPDALSLASNLLEKRGDIRQRSCVSNKRGKGEDEIQGYPGLVILGGLAGWLASRLVRGTGLGLIGDILIGIVGEVMGGFILGALGVTGFNLWSFVVALLSAILLLLIVRLFTGSRPSMRS